MSLTSLTEQEQTVVPQVEGTEDRLCTYPVHVVGIGAAVPSNRLTNQALEAMVDTSDEWIRTRTGIRERRIAPATLASSDLGLAAARVAMEQAGLAPADLDEIIVATVTPDYQFPSTACLLAARLGLVGIPAFDLAAGCSGLMYAIEQACQAIRSGSRRTVLVVAAETLSRVVNFHDRRTCVLFGDGAAALVLRRAGLQDEPGILATNLGSDGRGAHLLVVPAGGSRLPASSQTVAQGLHYLQMSGSEVFKFAVRVMEESTRLVMARAGLRVQDIDCFIPHQANVRIIQAAAERLGLPAERIMVNVDRYGNTSAASIGLALVEAYQQGRLHPGDVVAMTGFGTGLTWGSVALRWTAPPPTPEQVRTLVYQATAADAAEALGTPPACPLPLPGESKNGV